MTRRPKLSVGGIPTRVRRQSGAQAMTSVDAAAQLGISQTTLQKIVSSGEVQAPRQYQRMGSLMVGIYMPEDIEELRAYLKQRYAKVPKSRRGKPGAPKLFTEQQLVDRNRLRQSAYYHAKKAAAFAADGDVAMSEHHAALAKEARDELTRMRKEAEGQ